MPPQQGQCPFCQLIGNPDQLLTVGETDNFYAWLEVNPRARGHTMVVPKEHKENVLEFSMDEWQEAMKLTREVVEKAKKGLDADGVSITVNIEEAGGQMLPHAYIQVFPRFEDDENAGTPTGAIFPQQEDLQNKLDGIQNSMNNVSVDLGDSHEAHPDSQNFKDESEIENILKDSNIDGPDISDRTQQSEPEENDAEPDSGEREQEQVKQSADVDKTELSSQELLSELISRFGGPEELLDSDEFQRLISQTDMRIERVNEFSREQSIDWR